MKGVIDSIILFLISSYEFIKNNDEVLIYSDYSQRYSKL